MGVLLLFRGREPMSQTVTVNRDTLQELADYCHDEILMNDVQDSELEAAVIDAYDQLED